MESCLGRSVWEEDCGGLDLRRSDGVDDWDSGKG